MDPFKNEKYLKHIESQKKSSYIAKNISHVQKLSFSNKKQKDAENESLVLLYCSDDY